MGARLKTKIDNLGKIFIAGTGRSGTSILHGVLTRHNGAYKVPYESKFIVEGDGLSALIPMLTSNISLTATGLAFSRFIEMMDAAQWKTPDSPPSPSGLGYFERIGREFYFPPLIDYITALSDFELWGQPFPKVFEQRADLIAITRQFVSQLFGVPAVTGGKTFWVEKTPSNILSMDLLWELFPEATIVHIKRDPRGVLHSFMSQDWLPHDAANAAKCLEIIYLRWSLERARLNFTGRRYIELKLEDLAADTQTELTKISQVSGVPVNRHIRQLDLAAVDRWKTEMTAEARQLCETRLGRYFELMGYEI
jgi:hypothetical protein